ncbi:MAG: hypothetical protein PHQ98_00260 [Candidatus ainarchaeum sp.]|nr:hypothetical protein [Candidatus ainarchaeum sp.]
MAKKFKEKTITVNLREVFNKPETKRARCAKNLLKSKVEKETRVKNILITNAVNNALWAKGLFKSIRKIIVKVVLEKEDTVRVYLPDEKIIEKKETKKENLAKTEKKPVEAKATEVKKETEKKE